LENEIGELEKKMSEPSFWDNQDEANRLSEELSSKKRTIESFNRIAQELKDLQELVVFAEEDEDEKLLEEVQSGVKGLESAVGSLEISHMLDSPDDERDSILMIHSGAGGTESQDWANMLLRMYSRWIDRRGMEMDLMDLQEGEEAGIKSATLEVKGKNAYGLLKAENGIHRLVRISPFDANHRRHTSFASVFVFPVVENNVDVQIDEKDLRIDTYRASGAGGQHVNKTSSAVRITHIPTGIVVQCQDERSQHRNRSNAMKILRARLYQLKLEEERSKKMALEKKKKKIEWGSQIRSYILHPYNLVKDHRTGYETSNVSGVLDGDLDQFIEAYLLSSISKE